MIQVNSPHVLFGRDKRRFAAHVFSPAVQDIDHFIVSAPVRPVLTHQKTVIDQPVNHVRDECKAGNVSEGAEHSAAEGVGQVVASVNGDEVQVAKCKKQFPLTVVYGDDRDFLRTKHRNRTSFSVDDFRVLQEASMKSESGVKERCSVKGMEIITNC